MVGGLAATTHWIGNYPGFPEAISGQDLMQRMEEQARRFKVEFVFTPVSGVSKDSERRFKVDTGEGELLAKTAIIATGSVRRRLGVPFRAAPGARRIYCATCDGPFFRDKHVLIVGGGDTAIVEAMFLTRFASKLA